MVSSKGADLVIALITDVKGPLSRPDLAQYKNVINDLNKMVDGVTGHHGPHALSLVEVE